MRAYTAAGGLDAEVIKARRVDLGFSCEQLGARVGLTGHQIRNLEATRAATRWLTFQTVLLLAEALALPVRDIVAGPAGPPDGTDDTVRKIGAALAETDRPLTVETLCLGLGVDLQSIHDALNTLDSQLRPAGITVLRTAEGLRLGPAAPTPTDGMGDLRWVALLREELPTDLTAVIADVINGVQPQLHPNSPKHRRVLRLIHAGILTQKPGSDVPDGFSDDVAFSLRLDDRPVTKTLRRRK